MAVSHEFTGTLLAQQQDVTGISGPRFFEFIDGDAAGEPLEYAILKVAA